MKEKMIDKYPRPISIEGTKKILKQMEYNICKIYNNKGEKGTGFFCKISYKNKLIPVMMTNNHIIDEKYIKNNKYIKITINDDKVEREIILNDNRIFYTNEYYDTTIIEINPEKDKISNFMEIDENIFQKSNLSYIKHSIYIIQYPNSDIAAVSYGIIKEIIDEIKILHYCNTEVGSSGSPIINYINNKIIGIHTEGSSHFEINIGTYLKNPINEFINLYSNKYNNYYIQNQSNIITINKNIKNSDILLNDINNKSSNINQIFYNNNLIQVNPINNKYGQHTYNPEKNYINNFGNFSNLGIGPIITIFFRNFWERNWSNIIKLEIGYDTPLKDAFYEFGKISGINKDKINKIHFLFNNQSFTIETKGTLRQKGFYDKSNILFLDEQI